MGAGSFDRGWRIREHYRGGAKSGLWSYVSPTGDAFSVALEAAEAIEDEAVAAAAAAAMAAAEAPQMEGSAAIAAADAVVAEAPSRPSPAPSSSKKRGGASERKKPRSPHRSPHLGWSPITEEQRTSLREEEEGWLGEFEAYFRGKLSHKNAQQVMKHLTPLVAGKGVNFGPGVGNFLAGIPVTLSSDVANILDALHAEGNAAVRDHDDLKGGWHLRHPLYKLREFQAHKLGM
uniref:GIY-YIG domain-containing protein n=1 Tax=Emiliania huxleyi (strain CCMP1516) TaxID=280463 RepID=A0A0D3INF5_EMIH1